MAAWELRGTPDTWAARTGGLVPLLRHLEADWPHLFAAAAAKLDAKQPGAPRPWVPVDTSEPSVERAYKRAAFYLHPDRLTAADAVSDAFSLKEEAEDLLKVLTKKHADTASWFIEGGVAAAAEVIGSAV